MLYIYCTWNILHHNQFAYLPTYLPTYLRACMHVCMNVYVRTYVTTCICMHACIHTFIHTYIHTYIHTCIQWKDVPVRRYAPKHDTPIEVKSMGTGLSIHKLALILPAFTCLTCFNLLWNKALACLSKCKGMTSQSWPKSLDQNSHFE